MMAYMKKLYAGIFMMYDFKHSEIIMHIREFQLKMLVAEHDENRIYH